MSDQQITEMEIKSLRRYIELLESKERVRIMREALEAIAKNAMPKDFMVELAKRKLVEIKLGLT